MILDDFIMLGKTVPEANSDGREFVCTAGYSRELQMPVRIYPMARHNCPPRWSVSRIPLERNPQDNRRESWKIRGDRSAKQHADINHVIENIQSQASTQVQQEVVEAMRVRSLARANDERRSLCVIFPNAIPLLHFEPGEKAEMAPTPDLFGTLPQLPVIQRFGQHPRLRFVDENDSRHDLMLRDWGCYELMRKMGNDYANRNLELALNLGAAPPLLCGNFNRHRNSWLIISIFSEKFRARSTTMESQLSFDLPPLEIA